MVSGELQQVIINIVNNARDILIEQKYRKPLDKDISWKEKW